MVYRDGIEPLTPAFSDRLASKLSDLKSMDMVDVTSVMVTSTEDG